MKTFLTMFYSFIFDNSGQYGETTAVHTKMFIKELSDARFVINQLSKIRENIYGYAEQF